MDALILVGGKGTRLSATVPDVSKALAPVNGRPFLNYLVDFLKTSGDIGKIILSIGYKGDQIRQWAAGQPAKPEIVCVDEGEPLGTGGAILHVLDTLKTTNPILVMNGDSLVQLDLKAMAAQHQKANVGMTLAVTHVDDVARFGEVGIVENRVTEFREKNLENRPGWINAGVYVINPPALLECPRGACSFENDIIPLLLPSGIGAYRAPGPFIDIGVPESYAEAARAVKVSGQ